MAEQAYSVTVTVPDVTTVALAVSSEDVSSTMCVSCLPYRTRVEPMQIHTTSHISRGEGEEGDSAEQGGKGTHRYGG